MENSFCPCSRHIPSYHNVYRFDKCPYCIIRCCNEHINEHIHIIHPSRELQTKLEEEESLFDLLIKKRSEIKELIFDKINSEEVKKYVVDTNTIMRIRLGLNHPDLK